MHIDCVYIITLEKLTNKYIEDVLQKLTELGIDSYGWHMIEAVNGADIPADQKYRSYKNWDITTLPNQESIPQDDKDYRYWNRPMALGEIGCSLSHLKAWEDAKKANLDNILVLEQDFTLNSELTSNVDWAEIESVECDIFHLGGFKASDDPGTLYKDSKTILIDGTFTNTHAYLINNKKAINALADGGFRENLIPTDEYSNAVTHPGHRRPDIKEIFKPTLTMASYVTDEFPITQTDNYRRTLAGLDTEQGKEMLRELQSYIQKGEEPAEGFRGE